MRKLLATRLATCPLRRFWETEMPNTVTGVSLHSANVSGKVAAC